jgi:hypothetical protein
MHNGSVSYMRQVLTSSHLFVCFGGVWVPSVGHQVNELFRVVQGQVELRPAKLSNRIVYMCR